jgi:transcriptional regulator with XRE-family HTH domain
MIKKMKNDEGVAMYKSVGRRISSRMADLGLRNADLASKMGMMTTGTVKNWTTGHCMPKLSELPKLCAALKTDPNYLLLGRKK